MTRFSMNRKTSQRNAVMKDFPAIDFHFKILQKKWRKHVKLAILHPRTKKLEAFFLPSAHMNLWAERKKLSAALLHEHFKHFSIRFRRIGMEFAAFVLSCREKVTKQEQSGGRKSCKLQLRLPRLMTFSMHFYDMQEQSLMQGSGKFHAAQVFLQSTKLKHWMESASSLSEARFCFDNCFTAPECFVSSKSDLFRIPFHSSLVKSFPLPHCASVFT